MIFGNTDGPTAQNGRLGKVAIQTSGIRKLISVPLARYVLDPRVDIRPLSQIRVGS